MGLDVEAKPNGFGLTVCNVYAIFDNPNDVMIAVAGTPGIDRVCGHAKAPSSAARAT